MIFLERGGKMDIKAAIAQAEQQQVKIVAADIWGEIAQQFLLDHEGEDSREMIVQDLAKLLDVVWEAGKILQANRQ
jgi:hypothetical protein